MKHIGLLKSAETKKIGNAQTLIQHIPFDAESIVVKIPHGSSGVYGWISGFVQNLSPTFALFVTFYTSSKEIQEIEIPPLHELVFKNMSCEQLILRARTQDNNILKFGVFRYIFAVVIAENEDDIKHLLQLTNIQLVSIDPHAIFSELHLFIFFTINQSLPKKIFIPFNRQMIITNVKYDLLPSSLPNRLSIQNYTSMRSFFIDPPFTSTRLIDETILYQSSITKELKKIIFFSDLVGKNKNETLNSYFMLQVFDNMSTSVDVLTKIQYVII